MALGEDDLSAALCFPVGPFFNLAIPKLDTGHLRAMSRKLGFADAG
jgi:hypothetical protein